MLDLKSYFKSKVITSTIYLLKAIAITVSLDL